jgi:hypothetical protein
MFWSFWPVANYRQKSSQFTSGHLEETFFFTSGKVPALQYPFRPASFQQGYIILLLVIFAVKEIVDLDLEKTTYFSQKVPKKEKLHLYSSEKNVFLFWNCVCSHLAEFGLNIQPKFFATWRAGSHQLMKDDRVNM